MFNPPSGHRCEREFFIDNLLVRIHFIIVMIRWTGLAPWELEFPLRPHAQTVSISMLKHALSILINGFGEIIGRIWYVGLDLA